MPTGRFHSKFHITDDDDHHRYSDHLEFHVLELPKLGAADLADELAGWGLFFVARTDEERRKVGMTYPSVMGAVENLEELSRDEEFRQQALERELDWATERIRLGSAYHHGHEEGKAEGLRIAIAGVCEMLNLPTVDGRLEALDLGQLEQLLEHLLRERKWPEGM